jgi:hypothetical protein
VGREFAFGGLEDSRGGLGARRLRLHGRDIVHGDRGVLACDDERWFDRTR